MKSEKVTTTLLWVGDYPWYVGLTAASVLALIAWGLYRREAGGMRPIFRFLLPVLRSLAIFLIVVLLAGPVLHHRKVIGDLARLTFLLDGSESMQLADPGMDAGRKIQILERLQLLPPGSVNLDQPQASAALGEARNLAESVKAMESPTPEALTKVAKGFSSLVTKANGLLVKAKQPEEVHARMETELVKPTTEMAGREIKSTDEANRTGQELAKLGEAAGRWSVEVACGALRSYSRGQFCGVDSCFRSR